MRVKDVMAKEAFSCDAGSDAAQAIKTMQDNEIGCVVVTNSGSIAGIVTDRDLLIRGHADGSCFEGRKLSEFMTAPVVTVSRDADILDAVHMMNESSIRRLPVEENGQMIGIVSWSDLAHALDTPLHELVSCHSETREPIRAEA